MKTSDDDVVKPPNDEVNERLVADYQSALACGDVAAADKALAELLSRLQPYLLTVLRKVMPAIDRNGDLLDDALGEMQAVTIEMARRFDPDRCPSFSKWLGRRGCGELRQAIDDFGRRHVGVASLRDIDRKVVKVARARIGEFVAEHHREPTPEELYADMDAGAVEYHLAGVDPDLPEPVRVKMARQKAQRSGWLAALKNLSMLLACEESPIRPDAGDGEWDRLPASSDDGRDDDKTTLLLGLASGGADPTALRVLLGRLGPDEREDEGAVAIAARVGVPVAKVRSALAMAKARMYSAHVQFAYLGGGIEAQFEDAPSQPLKRVAALAAAARR